MQTNVIMETLSNGMKRDISVCTIEHDRLTVTENVYKYGESATVVVKKDTQVLGITSSPKSLLSIDMGNDADKAIVGTGLFIVSPSEGTIDIAPLGKLLATCNIITATEDNEAGEITLELDMSGINYSKLTGTGIDGNRSVEGEFFYFIFGNYSESKVYLLEVAERDKTGKRYEYVDDGTMNPKVISKEGIIWSRSGAVATIHSEDHGHETGNIVTLLEATTGQTASTALLAGDYTIAVINEDEYTVKCIDTGEVVGTLTEEYTYGSYEEVSPTILAAAMDRCINEMYETPVVSVGYLNGSLVITSLVAGVNNISIPYDYESVSTILGFDNAVLTPCIDISGKYVWANGLPIREIISSGGSTMVVSNSNTTAADLPDKRLYVVDADLDTTIKVTQA